MRLKIKSLQGDEYNVDAQLDQLVSQLKACISEKANGLPVERMKLVYKGRTMQDSNLISDYNLENDCKIHLILQKETILRGLATAQCEEQDRQASCPMDVTTRPTSTEADSTRPRSRFEEILRERLAKYFRPEHVEDIMGKLQSSIDADIHSSSLDDLERLAKQKLNISNE